MKDRLLFNPFSWILLFARVELLIPDLTPEEYREKDAELEPLRQFICEWFIPVEVKCEIVMKEHGSQQQTNTRLTLGYNTELNQ